MLELFCIFSFASIISFAGSIQLGPVNLAVIHTTLNHSFRAGIWVALGGCIPEIIYATLAFEGVSFLAKFPIGNVSSKLLIALVFIILGSRYLLLKPTPEPPPTQPEVKNHSFKFINGFLLGIFNFQILPFWVFILVFLDTYIKIITVAEKTAFIVGAAFGAFAILYLIAFLTIKYQNRINTVLKSYSINKVLGGVFLLMGGLQLIRLLL